MAKDFDAMTTPTPVAADPDGERIARMWRRFEATNDRPRLMRELRRIYGRTS